MLIPPKLLGERKVKFYIFMVFFFKLEAVFFLFFIF